MEKLEVLIPTWSPEEIEIQNKIYGEVRHHSPGMISFTYRPPTAEGLEKLKETETYKALFQKQP